MASTPSNLGSRNAIRSPCLPSAANDWLADELVAIENQAVREVVRSVCANMDAFVRWPQCRLLLWKGCWRSGKHRYPDVLKARAKAGKVPLDGRENGPAILAFRAAGGERPPRFGSMNAWSVHHVYSGKFPYHGRDTTLHAVKEGLHFTQSAGLVAVHPIADQMCDEFPMFTWLLRAEAFKRFGYDPDGVFSTTVDEYGFGAPGALEICFEPSVGRESATWLR